MQQPDAEAGRTSSTGPGRVAAPAGAAALHRQSGRLETLHVAGLWAVAVCQPLFDLLGRSPEFFVAHDTRPVDLLALVALLCLAGPACCLAAIRLGRRLGPVPHAVAAGAAVAALTGAVALAAVKHAAGWSTEASLAVAAACGALAGAGYARSSTVRLFATFLSPAALVVPAAFLLQPAIAALAAPRDATPPLAGIAFDDPPPVVFVVFDQLPLISLLDAEGEIDRGLYPGFAALADESTWFRNASAVAAFTNLALPAIATGSYPAPGTLPTANDHPANLFTLLGSGYRLHVHEPLTALCPAALCPPDRPGAGAWLAGVLSDLAVVYLQAVLPDRLAAELPPVTQGWRDFAAESTLQSRWAVLRDQDRRGPADGFIAAIAPAAGDVRPPLHFLHVLLPHEPWTHLPTGQRHSLHPHIVGGIRGAWRDDTWAVTLEYQRHLLQVQYVDTLLGELLERLRAIGLYDDALVIVTSDHGASLRPGASFRVPDAETFADVAAVPLLIKRPGQRRGQVSAANVETVDLLPTLAAELGLRLPWPADGENVFATPRAPRPAKTMFLGGTRLDGPADLGDAVAEGVARKLARFAGGDPLRPRLGVHDGIVGARIADLTSPRTAGFDIAIDDMDRLRDVDPDAGLVPARITGGIVPRGGAPAGTTLAIGLNGVVAAVTRPYSFAAFGHPSPWEAIVDPGLLRPGANQVDVFAIGDGPEGAPVLHAAAVRGIPAGPINLVLPGAGRRQRIELSGFLPPEASAQGFFRWTTGAARLSVEIDPQSPPDALDVRILTTGPQKRLRIAVNGCPLFDGDIFGRWEQTLPLAACPLDSPTLDVELRTNVHLGPTERRRRLGVGVAAIELQGGGPAP